MRRIAPALKDELIAAVTRYGVAGKRVDLEFLRLRQASITHAVNPRYGDLSFVGRKKKAIARRKANAIRRAKNSQNYSG